jgi:hypothetical protein
MVRLIPLSSNLHISTRELFLISLQYIPTDRIEKISTHRNRETHGHEAISQKSLIHCIENLHARLLPLKYRVRPKVENFREKHDQMLRPGIF